MIGQAQALAGWYEYYAGIADKLEGRQIPTPNPDFLVYTRSEPVGVVAAITPWNSPLLLLSWKLAPRSPPAARSSSSPPSTPRSSTLELAGLVVRRVFPPGVVNVVTGASRELGKALAAHPAWTRSPSPARPRSAARSPRPPPSTSNKVTLELGGKSAQIVFDDADLDAAANGVVAGVFAATGQTCMAGSRLIVHADVTTSSSSAWLERAEQIVLGDPTDPATEMGPVANRPQYETVPATSRRAAGGRRGRLRRPARDRLGGLFVQPTVLTGVDPR